MAARARTSSLSASRTPTTTPDRSRLRVGDGRGSRRFRARRTWSRGFSAAAGPESRQAFVASCIDAYIRGNLPVTDGAGAAAGVFDGIDIDWEYPNACGLTCGSREDRQNFTELLAEFRNG